MGWFDARFVHVQNDTKAKCKDVAFAELRLIDATIINHYYFIILI